MKAATELISQFASMDLPEKEKIDWLEKACSDYVHQMPNDRRGQSSLYSLLGEEYLKTGDREKAEAAFERAKEILEEKTAVRKKVGCGFQDIEKDLTETREYALVMERLEEIKSGGNWNADTGKSKRTEQGYGDR